jgi:hypothetical protein
MPTGWDVIQDLSGRLAVLKGDDAGEDATAWYQRKYGVRPEYGTLLEQLGGTPAERRALLARYFEPTPEEREQGQKIPTAAHRDIAALVAEGSVRVIITTNFDQLLELALRDAGVVPQVIASADDARGVIPLAHAPCTVVKVNGDYLDTRIRNTQGELKDYEPELKGILDDVFDEYGLVVCGWSAEWDEGLRAAIVRAPNRRFSTYWALRGELAPLARRAVEARSAVIIPIESADAFFSELVERVRSLTALDQTHPASVQALVATMKRHLAIPEHWIRLTDLISIEVERAIERIARLGYGFSGGSREEVRGRAVAYARCCDSLIALAVAGGYWGRGEQVEHWKRAIRRLASVGDTPESGTDVLLDMRYFPALLVTYAAGVGAIAGQQFTTLHALLSTPVRQGGEEVAVVISAVFRSRAYAQYLSAERHYTPLSDFIHQVLRAPGREVLPDGQDYDEAFDMFEYLVTILNEEAHSGLWALYGRFGWRWRGRPEQARRMAERVLSMPAGPLSAGMLDGSPDRFRKAAATVATDLQKGYWW